MTREEAINEWTFRSNHIKEWLDEYGEEPSIRHYVELIDMAIEALSQPIVAKHFDIQSGYIYCSPQNAENVKVVVRCKDCRWWNEDEFPRAFPEKKTCMCECPNIYGFNHFGRFTQEDEFCSRGERREE